MAKNKEDIGVQDIKSTNLKPCFIITPISELNSAINLKARGLINSVLKPVLIEFGFEALPAYEMADSGSINRQVLKSIISNELVIANLTGLNPNVMYELAVRHAVRLPVIIMAEEGTKLPFDINDQRTIFYSDTLLGSEIAKPLLSAAIEAVLSLKEKGEQIDNPIYQVYEEISIIKATKGKDQSVDEYLLKRFDRLESAIGRISNNFQKNDSLEMTTFYPEQSIIVQSNLPNSKDVQLELAELLIDGHINVRTIKPAGSGAKGAVYTVSLSKPEDIQNIQNLFKNSDKFTLVGGNLRRSAD